MGMVVLVMYGLLLGFILLFSLGQLHLTVAYLRQKARPAEPEPPLPQVIPRVTVQLPVFNERHVVERLIDRVCAFDWPLDRLEVQVLDDSDDETVGLAAARCAAWRERGVDIVHLRRGERTGYKAGALAFGTARAKGGLIAIFDADFLPDADFLRRTVPWFADPGIGMVQTRWGHLNREGNLLTRLQAFGLDAHFSVEQVGRNALGHFINFNGTGGVWRKRCIAEAGGWRPDSLTEDLDLSYRAQLAGWRFRYLEHVVCPAELPAEMNALKAQQRRWNKGAAECVRLDLGSVLRHPRLSLGTKVHAVLHLMNSTVFLAVIGLVLLSGPVLWLKHRHPELQALFQAAMVFTFSLLVLAVYYAVAQRNSTRMPWRTFVWQFPLFLALSMGLSLHNALAVAEGYLGIRSGFVRTPKLGLVGKADGLHGDRYLRTRRGPLLWFEGLLFLYAVAALWAGWLLRDGGLWLFHGMLALGFGAVFSLSLLHSMRLSR